ncbi:MAG: succinylglutamate desuccinylase/aspartoacylase family protein [Candidatus Gracilibacteria bacterium]|nr:succinylglutamate desuccinylase/aspartoacylase family protein [Candidatus Gracilibacteria bacterium]
MKLPEQVYQFGFGARKVAIVGGVHGDEKVGVLVVEKLRTYLEGKTLTGTAFLIIGNPRAVELNKRFVDEDLNRLFHFEFDTKNPQTLEQKRALELAPVLEQCHFGVDLHSTIKPSVPFVYTKAGGERMKLARCFDVECIVTTGTPTLNCLDGFIDRNPVDGQAFTVETGWHKDLEKVDGIFASVVEILNTLEVLESGVPPGKRKKPQELTTYLRVIVDHPSFRFTQELANFQRLPAGTVIAKSDLKEFRLDRDSVVLFPKSLLEVGKPAVTLAE